jgi:hypothetical protein
MVWYVALGGAAGSVSWFLLGTFVQQYCMRDVLCRLTCAAP